MKYIAEFNAAGNDLFWRLRLPNGDVLRWSGYDDANWWNKVSTTAKFRERTDSNGNLYSLNPATDEIISNNN